MKWLSESLQDTLALGRKLGSRLQKGDVIGLIGPLGAGKTTLVRGIAEGLNIDPSFSVTSPTFVFAQIYQGPLPLYHIDLYRIESRKELPQLGLEEMMGEEGVAVIEWFDRFTELWPGDRYEIRMDFLGDSGRQLNLLGIGEKPKDVVSALGRR